MLLAVGTNPTIDRTLQISRLSVGAVHRAGRVELGAGGKGLNVTRVALTLGCQAMVTGPLGGHTGRLLAELTAAEPLPADWYWLAGVETRSTTLLNHATGDTTVINEPGPPMSAGDWDGFVAHVTRLAGKARAVAFCGSVLPGVPDEGLASLARSLVAPERAVYVDSSAAALAAALARPDGLWIKVNQAELAAGLGRKPEDLPPRRLVEAGQRLLERGAAMVAVTLGGEGALAMAPEGAWHLYAPPVKAVSTVGSGDSFLAGLAVARLAGRSLPEALAMGVACGAANTLTPLPGRLDPAVVDSLLARVVPVPV